MAQRTTQAGPANEFRVALIGYGLAGAVFHAPLIAAVGGLRLTAVVTRDLERQRQVGRDHPEAAVVSRVEDVWARATDFDLVVVATPNRTHVPLARAGLEAGLAVVVDKPFAPTAMEARGLVREANERGLLLAPFQNRRWDGDFLTVQRLLRDGALGEPFRFESRFERWRPVPKPGWRESSAPEEAGGILYDLGSHLVDQAMVLFGPVEQVYAHLDRRRPGVAVDDDAFVALTHRSGVRAHLIASAVAAEAGPRMRLLGRRAAYTKYGLDGQEDALRRGAHPGTPGWGEEPPERWGHVSAGDQQEPVRTEPGGYERFYAGIADALRHSTPAPVDPVDAINALEVLEAARQSATERRVVILPSRASA